MPSYTKYFPLQSLSLFQWSIFAALTRSGIFPNCSNKQNSCVRPESLIFHDENNIHFTRASDDTWWMFHKEKMPCQVSIMDRDPKNQCEWLNEGFQYYFHLSYQRVIYFLRWSDPIVAWPHNQDIILLRANNLIVQEQYFYQSYPTIIYCWNYFSRSLNLEISCRRQICSEAFNHNFFFVM